MRRVFIIVMHDVGSWCLCRKKIQGKADGVQRGSVAFGGYLGEGACGTLTVLFLVRQQLGLYHYCLLQGC